MDQFFFKFLEQIASSPAAHARTYCDDCCGCRAEKMASEILEIFNVLEPHFNAFMAVGIWHKYFRRKFSSCSKIVPN